MELKGPPYLVDGHVHLHACFDTEKFFRAADDNFEAAGRALGLPEAPGGILLFAESAGTHRFKELQRLAGDPVSSGLDIESTGEEPSLLVAPAGGNPMMVVAGRQLVTAEDLEVLALGCTSDLPDGRLIGATLDLVREVGAIPVIPWGFGKWHSNRRRALLELLQQRAPGKFFLGDNGGRAALLSLSPLFRSAAESGIRNLPGSDPLPFAREAQRAGSYGFVFNEQLDPEAPATDLLRQLARSESGLRTYGSGLGARAFLLNQVGMQIRKRLRGKRQ